MEEFAQTRELDNLFEDDFTPIPQPGAQNVEPRNQQVQQRHSIRSSAPKASDPPANDQVDPNATIRPPSAVRGDRSATGGINKPKLTETELSARLAAAKLNNARREEAHRLAEADEASFQKREAQASQKRREEGAARRAMEGEREKNRLRKLGAQRGREWDEGKEEQDTTSSPNTSQYRRGAHGGIARRGGRQQDVYDDYGRGDQDPEGSGYGYTPRGGRSGRGRSDRSRGDTGRGRGPRGRGSSNQHHEPNPREPPHSAPPKLHAETEFPSLPRANPPHRSSESQSALRQEVPQKPQPAPLQSEEDTAGDGSAGTGTGTGSRVAELKDPPSQITETFSPVGEKQSWSDQVETQAPKGGW